MRRKWIIYCAILIHAIWGMLMLLDPHALAFTASFNLREIIGQRGAGAVYLAASVLAVASLVMERKFALSLCCVLLQQALMVESAAAAINAMVSSSFPDGVIRPRAFIVADQCPAVVICVMHTLAILEFYTFGLREKLFRSILPSSH